MDDDENEVERYASAHLRLDALAKAVNGISHAIAGLGASKRDHGETITELKEQLLFMAKRLSWVEKQSDPDWKPYKDQAH